MERLAVQPDGIGVLHGPGERRDRARNPDPHASATPGLVLQPSDQSDDGLKRAVIVVTRRGDAMTAQFPSLVVESDRFRLRTAEIDADAHVRSQPEADPRPHSRTGTARQHPACRMAMGRLAHPGAFGVIWNGIDTAGEPGWPAPPPQSARFARNRATALPCMAIYHAGDRQTVVSVKSVTVRVALGVRPIIT